MVVDTASPSPPSSPPPCRRRHHHPPVAAVITTSPSPPSSTPRRLAAAAIVTASPPLSPPRHHRHRRHHLPPATAAVTAPLSLSTSACAHVPFLHSPSLVASAPSVHLMATPTGASAFPPTLSLPRFHFAVAVTAPAAVFRIRGLATVALASPMSRLYARGNNPAVVASLSTRRMYF
ncbi:hypothetical protein HYPSUDRAFT_209174 [Hypholoma sublateritium FD-334 SS-4]|uniref:Uncharacterized protein n=1 Tax=Hypholoma sublateritium (strain FD-334 SS-4) TaxID=945553 RepID=A0A0D2LSS6_HYPSF|nr:hypothetical protein HYPSUDRAFT_209174 [Hypholoma sublateritium FD-334 SS-4]